jgi:hypothetical protein
MLTSMVFFVFFGLCGCPVFLFVGVKCGSKRVDTGEAYPPALSEAVLWIPLLGVAAMF